MRYKDVVEKAKKEIRGRKSYENKHIILIRTVKHGLRVIR